MRDALVKRTSKQLIFCINTMEPVKIYLSSSDEDKHYHQKLIVNLAGLKRQGKIKVLNDNGILPGNIWEEQILQWLKEAELVLFLVSSDFIASDFIYDVEIQKVLDCNQKGKVKIIPIIIRPCDFESLPICQFKVLPLNKIPVSVWENEDEAWLQIIIQLKKVIKGIINEKTMQIPNQKTKAPVIRRLFPLASLAATASLLLLFTFSISNNSNNKLLDKLYSQYSYNVSFSQSYDLEDGIEAYQNHDYPTALSIFNNNPSGDLKFQLAKGNAEYNLGKYDEAINTFNFVIDRTGNPSFINLANWYLALTYLKKGNKQDSIELLKTLPEDAEFYSHANDLLGELTYVL